MTTKPTPAFQPSPTECHICEGSGYVETGIDKTRAIPCGTCNGTGMQPSPARSDKDAERVTLRSFKGHDDKEWHIVIEHPFGTTWARMGNERDVKLAELLSAKAQESAPSSERVEGFDLSLAAVEAYDPQSFIDGAKWQARRATAGNAAPTEECGNCFEGKSDGDHICRVCNGSGVASNAATAAPGDLPPLPERSEGIPGDLNHREAYELACFKREHSNLARCYLDLASNARAAPAMPEHLCEFVEAIAVHYVHEDSQGSTHCNGCGANLGDDEEHHFRCIVVRAKKLLAPSTSPADTKEKDHE